MNSKYIRSLLVIGVLLISGKIFAMQCGNVLINEGNTSVEAINACGTPSFNNSSTLIYSNKDGGSISYTLHVNSSGIIDNVTF